MNDILTEKNALQRRLHDVTAQLERGQYHLSAPARERYGAALSGMVPSAGRLSFSKEGAGIEPLLLEMTGSLEDIFLQGDEEAGEAVLKALMESMDFLSRTDRAWSALPERERADRQRKVIGRMNLLVTLQRSLVTVERQIRGLEESQSELEKKQRAAADRIEGDRLAHPALERELALFRDGGEIPGPAFLAHIRHVNAFIRSSNLSRRNAIVLERQSEVKGQLEGMLHTLNMMIFGTPELLGNVELAKLAMAAEDFKEELAAAGEQSERLESISEDVGNTIDALGTAAARKNQDRITRGRELLEKYRRMR